MEQTSLYSPTPPFATSPPKKMELFNLHPVQQNSGQKTFPSKAPTQPLLLLWSLCFLFPSSIVCAAASPCLNTNGLVVNSNDCQCGLESCFITDMFSQTGLICYSTVGEGACRKSNVGAYGYNKVTAGLCLDASVPGRTLIGDAASCRIAVESMGFYWTEDNDDGSKPNNYFLRNQDNLPAGCLIEGRAIYFNQVLSSTSPARENGVTSVCMSAPTCLHTLGSTLNEAPCSCGMVGCSETSGLYCSLASNTCASGPLCVHTNGQAANPGPCKCGKEQCLTGSFICFNTIGSGSCRSSGFGPFGFTVLGTGQCNDDSDRRMIRDVATCEAAAVAYGRGVGTTASVVPSVVYPFDSQPPGCTTSKIGASTGDGTLWYNG